MDKPVFISAFLVCGLLVLSFFIAPVQMNQISERIFNFLMQNFKWCFVLAADIIIVFCLFIAFSKYGRIRLGKDTDRPEFSNLSWFAMMFSAGMGVGLIFFGVTEPMSHFMDPLTTQAWTGAAATESMYITFFIGAFIPGQFTLLWHCPSLIFITARKQALWSVPVLRLCFQAENTVC